MAEGSDSAGRFQPSKMTKSEVWSYFGFYKSPEGNLIEYDHPVCRTCTKKVAAIGANTSNLQTQGKWTLTSILKLHLGNNNVKLPRRKVHSKWL